MAELVADTSGLVSLGIAADRTPNPLSLSVEAYDVFVPEEVMGELEAVGSYDDDHGRAATAALDTHLAGRYASCHDTDAAVGVRSK